MNRSLIYVSTVPRILQNAIRLCSSSFPSTVEKANETETLQITDEIEIDSKRDVSRLPSRIRQYYMKKEMVPLIHKHHFLLSKLRKYYAALGEKSGINPGIMWPSKKYLKELKEYENIAHLSFEEMVCNMKEKERKDLEERKQREEEVEANMVKYKSILEEFKARKRKHRQEALAQIERKEKLISEVHEYLGYELEPHDARFQEVLKMKEEEAKKAKKKAKKKEREQQMLATLLQIGSDKDDSSKKS